MNQNQVLPRLLAGLTLLMAVAFVGVAPVASSSVANYAITSYTIDGGGPIQVGDGRFALSGTVGQPDGSILWSDGRFALVSGFWRPSGLVDKPTPPNPGGTQKPVFLPLVIR